MKIINHPETDEKWPFVKYIAWRPWVQSWGVVLRDQGAGVAPVWLHGRTETDSCELKMNKIILLVRVL